MSEPLFREEAILAMSSRHLDVRSLKSPVSMLAASIGLFLFTLLSLSLLGSFTYARKHLVTGQLDETSTAVLHATNFGFVDLLDVEEGDAVTQGQQLGQINYRDDERNSHGVTELRSQVSQLSVAINETSVSASHKLQALSEQERRVMMRISIGRKNLELQNSKVEELEHQLTRTGELHNKGYLSNLDWLGFRTGLVNEQQQRFRYQEHLVELEQQVKDLGHRKQVVETDKREALLQLELSLSQARERLRRAEVKPYQVLEANHDGIVSRIEVNNGGSVTPGQPVIYINDEQEVTTATLLVPPLATGHLNPGDELPLELDAFPLETFGHVMGEVLSIPKHTVMLGKVPVYPVRLRIRASPKIRVYLPGMTLTGFITVERKRLGQWLLAPLNRKLESLS